MVSIQETSRKPAGTRIEHRERMHREILGAARKLVMSGGIDNLTMRTLGREVGVTAATLYGYFPSKEAVLDAIVTENSTAMNDALEDAAAGFAPGAARLFAFAIGYRRFARTSTDFFSKFIYKLEPPAWDEFGDGAEDDIEVLGTLYREITIAMQQGEIRPLSTPLVCRALWAAAHGYVSLEANDCLDTARLSEDEQERRYLEYMVLVTQGIFVGERVGPALARFGLQVPEGVA